MANSVRVSNEYDDKIEKLIDKIENESGFRPNKKQVVEKGIDELLDKYN